MCLEIGLKIFFQTVAPFETIFIPIRRPIWARMSKNYFMPVLGCKIVLRNSIVSVGYSFNLILRPTGLRIKTKKLPTETGRVMIKWFSFKLRPERETILSSTTCNSKSVYILAHTLLMSWLWISLGLSIVLPQMLELYEQVLPFPYPSLKDLDIEMVSTSSIYFHLNS